MRRLTIFLAIVAYAKIGNTQSIPTAMGARQAGMGYASSGLVDEWALFSNAGAIGSLNKMSAAFAYEASALLPGADRMAFAFNAPTRWGVSSIGVFRFGDDLYNEQMLTAAFANTLGIASLGVRVNYIQYYAEGFGSNAAFTVDFGGVATLTEQLTVGAYITNLNQAKIHTSNGVESLPTRLIAGLTFKPSNNLTLATEIDKDLAYVHTWRTGIEYAYKQKIFYRTGFNLNPNTGFFGMGFKKGKIQIDYALQFSWIRGTSHQASASYLFSKKK